MYAHTQLGAPHQHRPQMFPPPLPEPENDVSLSVSLARSCPPSLSWRKLTPLPKNATGCLKCTRTSFSLSSLSSLSSLPPPFPRPSKQAQSQDLKRLVNFPIIPFFSLFSSLGGGCGPVAATCVPASLSLPTAPPRTSSSSSTENTAFCTSCTDLSLPLTTHAHIYRESERGRGGGRERARNFQTIYC